MFYNVRTKLMCIIIDFIITMMGLCRVVPVEHWRIRQLSIKLNLSLAKIV